MFLKCRVTTWYTNDKVKFQITVTVNGYHAACLTDCSFEYNSNGVPSVTSMTDSFGMFYQFSSYSQLLLFLLPLTQAFSCISVVSPING